MNVHVAVPADEVQLVSEERAFSRGGNRLCFVDPRDSDRCIKVLRADRSPARKRSERGFLKRLKPLSSFDDNLNEAQTYQRLLGAYGESLFRFAPRLYGWVATDLGKGLCSELIRDTDGRIAITLKQYLWQRGRTAALEQLLDDFSAAWIAGGIASRNLLLHNLVVQCDGDAPERLVVIDGLGWPDLVPLAYHVPAMARAKARRRTQAMQVAIDALLERRKRDADYGFHGWLEDSQRQ